MFKRISKALVLTLLTLFILTSITYAQQSKVLDKIVAIVNNHIILKSDVDSVVAQYMQQSNKDNFSKQLWYHALQSEVNKFVLMEKAKIDSITVTDDQIDRQLNQRISQMEQQAGSKKALENYFGKSIVELKAQWRPIYKQQAVVQKLRQQEESSINITRPEVRDFFNSIPKDSIPNVPEQVQLAQIVKIPPPDSNAEASTLKLAKELRDSIVVYHKNFSELAKRWSQGPSAKNGGHLGLISINDLVPSYSAAAAALKPGEISKVVKSPFGYHIIRLNKRVGDKIDTDHILLKVNENKRDDQKAINFLNKLRDSVLVDHKNFAELARKYSDDEATAPRGGLLENPQTGARLIPIKQLDPALYRIVLLLDKEGQISKPKPFTTSGPNNQKAYRIVQLKKRIEEHQANLKQDFELIKNIALRQKQARIMQKWLKNLRNEIYVEYKIPVPDDLQS